MNSPETSVRPDTLGGGRYRLGELLGYGGMAEVRRARDLRLGRDVAIKMLRSDLAADRTFRDRFRREAQNAASLNHPAIVAIYDTGEERDPSGTDRLYIVMELVEGHTLREILADRGRLELQEAVLVAADVCGALEYSHRNGIIHRDIKPGNVMVAHDGRVKVMDFGIARALSPGYGEADNAVIGTAAYLSPEQARGEPVDARSDVYAVGCLLFDLLCGRPPFLGDSPVSLAYRHVRDSPEPPSTFAPGTTPDVDAIVLTALAKDPAARYRSAAEMRADLLRAAGGRAVLSARPPGSGDPAPTSSAPTGTAPYWAPPTSGPPTAGRPTSGPPTSGPPTSGPPPSGPPTSGPPTPDPAFAPSTSAPARGRSWWSTAGAPRQFPQPQRPRPPHNERHIPLRPEFRYVNEPLTGAVSPIPTLGHQELVGSVTERIRYSTGGAFLLVGFRGSGKTTLVRYVARHLEDDTDHTYLFLNLDVARPISSQDFLFRIVRRLRERLDDAGLLARLRPDVRHAVDVAYRRTSMAIAIREEAGREQTRSGGITMRAALAGGAGPGGDATAQRSVRISRLRAEETSFLSYTESDAEYDLIRIVDLLRAAPLRRPSLWNRLLGRSERPVRVVIVVDELDKLTSDEAGVASLNELLLTLKNVLTAAGVHTLFVGGTELLDMHAADTHHGIGIFESVFSWIAYVPCLWQSPQTLLDGIVVEVDPWTRTFEQYLRYRTRGIPRRLLQEVNGHVRWRDGQPVIVAAEDDAEKIHLYSDLAASVEGFLGDHRGERHSSPGDDRFRLGAYFLLDWVLRSEGGVFDAREIVEQRAATSVLPVSEPIVAAFLEHLSAAMIVDRVSGQSPYVTMGSASMVEQQPRYRLSGTVRERLMRIARTNLRERSMLLDLPRPRAGGATDPLNDTLVLANGSGGAGPSAPDFAVPRAERSLADGRYELVEMLNAGSMSTVYRGRVAATGEAVKIKVLRPSAAHDDEIKQRFIREAATGRNIRHRGIVRTRELVSEGDRLAIVMDFVSGETLEAVIHREDPLPPADAIRICATLLAAVHHLHDQGIYRLDIKPANVVLRPNGEPVIVDIGLARQADAPAVTRAHALVGTAAYMAPEQIADRTADHRSDIFSIGLVLFELLSGTRHTVGSDLGEILHRRTAEELPLDQLYCSPELREVLAHMTARDADARYGSADAARIDLLATPEAGPAHG